MRTIDSDDFLKQSTELYEHAGWDEREFHFSLADLRCNLEMMPTVEAESKWIPVSERLPETIDAVNVTWINRQPESYYADIKDKPFTGTAHYCKGEWWWDSCVCQDYLKEYGNSPGDEVDEAIEIVAWMPLPKPYEVKEE